MSNLASQIQTLHDSMIARGQTLALAESCTGGRFSSEITKLAGSSKYFLGAVVSYHGQVKHKILKVPMTLLKVLGEVSTPVALEMARGARSEIDSDWAVSISGIAGPTGGSEDKPVGYVCFAIVGPGFEWSGAQRFGSNLSREQIQIRSVEFATEALLKALSGGFPDASQ